MKHFKSDEKALTWSIFNILPDGTRIVGDLFLPTLRTDNTYRCVQVLFPDDGKTPSGRLRVIGITFDNEIAIKYDTQYEPELITVVFDNSSIQVPLLGERDGYPIVRLPTGEAAIYSIMTECFIERPYKWK